MSRCCLSASHTPSTTWVAPRTLIRSGSSTNHIPILRVLWGPTTHSRECFSGARNSISPSPTVSIAKASMSLLFPSAMYTAKLRGAPPHGDQGQDTEAHKRYSRHKWQGDATGVGQLRRHARGSTRRWACRCGCRWACGCARRGSRHLSASGDVNACRHLGMDRALVSVGLARVIVLERERVSVTRL